MSLPDCLLDLPDEHVCECGLPVVKGREVCAVCLADAQDVYADELITEGRRTW